MRASRQLYTAPKETTDFNIFMSGPEWGQPVMRASDIVKNMMELRAARRPQPKFTAMEVHSYPEINQRSAKLYRN